MLREYGYTVNKEMSIFKSSKNATKINGSDKRLQLSYYAPAP